MRPIINNNYGNVTVQFAYHGGTGFAVAYTGKDTERLWMPPVRFDGCKSRDEAELKAIYFLVNGDSKKDTYAQQGINCYSGFNKNARIRLIGFDAMAKGIYSTHKANQGLWKEVLGYFGHGKNGLRFDLLSINNTYSKAIANAQLFCWTAENRDQHAAEFKALVSGAVKTAKAQKAMEAKCRVSGEAKTEPAPKATIKKEVA